MKISKRWILAFTVLLFLSITQIAAQPMLILLRKNSIQYRYYVGDYIRLEFKSTNAFRKGNITSITRDRVTLSTGDTVSLFDIKAVDIHGKPRPGLDMGKGGRKLMAAGLLLLVIDQTNPQTDRSSKPVVVVSCLLLGTGIFMQFAGGNYFKTGGKNRISVLGAR